MATLILAGAGEPGLAQSSEVVSREVDFNIPAQPLTSALLAFSAQSGLQVITSGATVPAQRTPAVTGRKTIDVALLHLLKDTGLKYQTVGKTTVTLVPSSQQKASGEDSALQLRLADSSAAADQHAGQQRTTEETAAPNEAENTRGVPEILVRGKKTLNMDIERTEDAPQPYVVFGREDIRRSQAATLEDFFRTRLPMNAASTSFSNFSGSHITLSGINLRGLGANQTLILVDGRRMPGYSSSGTLSQPDINGIPLAAIERIEVLPSTAGGIHGGSATGGVINIILRRDFRGVEAQASYVNTFDTDTASTRLDVGAGLSLEGGRTRVMFTASHSSANKLLIGDRDFAARAVALQMANNPGAITGSFFPPVGGTPNIRSVFGVLELDPEFGGGSLASNITHLPLGYTGPASDNGAALIANAGAYNLDSPDDLNGARRSLSAAPAMESATLNVRRDFSERFEAFLDLSRLGNKGRAFNASVPNLAFFLPFDAPNNPFEQDINVSFPTPGMSFESRFESTTVRASGGLIARLPHGWTGAADYGWSRSRATGRSTQSAVDEAAIIALDSGLPPGDGRPALNALQEGNTFPLDWTPYLLPYPNRFDGPADTVLSSATLRLSGPALDLPAGALVLSALIERRDEEVRPAFIQNISPASRAQVYTYYPRRSQEAHSYYLEARAPLIAPARAVPFARELELQASVRRDAYKTRSDGGGIAGYDVPSRGGPFPALEYSTNRLESTDYTVGLRLVPLQDLALRASIGTGFLPPSITQIVSVRNVTIASFGADPKRGFTSTDVGQEVAWITGGNPSLRPEHSESWSAGFILTPRWLPGLRLSVDYTRIGKKDEILAPAAQFLLDNEDAFPGRIARAAPVAGEPAGWAGPITTLDTSAINLARTAVQAYDIQLDYEFSTQRLGDFHWRTLATWQPHYRNRLNPTVNPVDRAGHSGGPLKLRGNTELSWDRGPLTLGWSAQYYDSYFVYAGGALPVLAALAARNQGSDTIPGQLYHDFVATWRLRGRLAGSELTFGVQNVLDKSPPILATSSPGSTGYSPYGDPRLRRYSISLRKSFR